MAVDTQSDEGRLIRQLIPLSRLSNDKFAQLCQSIEVQEVGGGHVLFQCGDASGDFVYLLKGSVTLKTDFLNIETIKAGSDSARFALAHQTPRKVNAVADGRVRFLRIPATMLDFSLPVTYQEQPSDMVVQNTEESEDWMSALLRLPIFMKLPPSNLQKILTSLQEVTYKAGEVIIEQGGEGDYYYIIKKGHCLISRKPTATAKEIKLGQMTDWDAFGEDALITGEPRGVTVSAIVETVLFRLKKDQFNQLIKQPPLEFVSYERAQELIEQGSILVDVRGPDEYNKYHLPHSINMPFFSFRMQIKSLNRQTPIVVICRDGRISESAVFVLLRYRFSAVVLKGGIESIQTHVAGEESAAVNRDSEQLSSAQVQKMATAATEISTPDSDVNNLRQVAQHLKARCAALEAEKKLLESKCATLAKQLALLKAELAKRNKEDPSDE
jgi:CRP-like cAMP-binding protein/rhodanese-related sulfurtransferase